MTTDYYAPDSTGAQAPPTPWYSPYLNRFHDLPDPRQVAGRVYGGASAAAGNAYGAASGFTTRGETEKIPFGKNTGWLFGLIGGIVVAALLIPMQFADLVRYGKAQKCSGSGSGSSDDDDDSLHMSVATILGFVTLGTAGLLIGVSFWILFHFDAMKGTIPAIDEDSWRPITAPTLVFVVAFFALALTYGIMYAIQKPIGDDDDSNKKKKDKGGDDDGEDGDDDGGKFQNWHAGFGGATAGTAGLLGLAMVAAFFKLKKGSGGDVSPSSVAAAGIPQGAAAMAPGGVYDTPSYTSGGSLQ